MIFFSPSLSLSFFFSELSNELIPKRERASERASPWPIVSHKRARRLLSAILARILNSKQYPARFRRNDDDV